MKTRDGIWCFSIALLITLIPNISAYVHPVFTHDDWVIIGEYAEKPQFFLNYYFPVGRYLQAYVSEWYFQQLLGNTLLSSCLLLANHVLLFIAVIWSLRKIGLSIYVSALVSISFFLTHSVQLSLLWPTLAAHVPTLAATFLAYGIVAQHTNRKGNGYFDSKVVMATFILSLAVFAYEPYIFVWGPLMFLHCLTWYQKGEGIKNVIQNLVYLAIPFVLVSMLRLFSQVYSQQLFDLEFNKRTSMIGGLTDFFNNILLFYEDMLPRAVNFWGFEADKGLFWMFILLIISLLIITTQRSLKQSKSSATWTWSIALFILFISTIIFSYLPSLIVESVLPRYRLVLATQFVVVSTFIVLLMQLVLKRESAKTIAGLVLVPLLLTPAIYRSEFFIQSQRIELAAIKSFLSMRIEESKHLHIQLESGLKYKTRKFLEFGYSGNSHWSRAAIGLARYALKDIEGEIEERVITASDAPKQEALNLPVGKVLSGVYPIDYTHDDFLMFDNSLSDYSWNRRPAISLAKDLNKVIKSFRVKPKKPIYFAKCVEEGLHNVTASLKLRSLESAGENVTIFLARHNSPIWEANNIVHALSNEQEMVSISHSFKNSFSCFRLQIVSETNVVVDVWDESISID